MFREVERAFEVPVICKQDLERGRQSNLTTLLAEVSERGMPKPSREEADRLKRDVRHCSHLYSVPLSNLSLCLSMSH